MFRGHTPIGWAMGKHKVSRTGAGRGGEAKAGTCRTGVRACVRRVSKRGAATGPNRAAMSSWAARARASNDRGAGMPA